MGLLVGEWFPLASLSRLLTSFRLPTAARARRRRPTHRLLPTPPIAPRLGFPTYRAPSLSAANLWSDPTARPSPVPSRSSSPRSFYVGPARPCSTWSRSVASYRDVFIAFYVSCCAVPRIHPLVWSWFVESTVEQCSCVASFIRILFLQNKLIQTCGSVVPCLFCAWNWATGDRKWSIGSVLPRIRYLRWILAVFSTNLLNHVDSDRIARSLTIKSNNCFFTQVFVPFLQAIFGESKWYVTTDLCGLVLEF
jgi:hypothetical protein